MAEPVKEDTNLDDFFAKKDKTKKKSKSRLTPADIETQMEKKLKKKATAAKKKEKDSTNSTQSAILAVKLEEDDGEWKEVEEETETDYSDLRIQNLKISSKDEEDKERQENFQSGEEGDERGNKEGPQGPWKFVQSSAPVVASVVPEAKETDVPAEPEKDVAKPAQKYVPPGARRAAAQQQSGVAGTSAAGGRRKKVAPNFSSQDDFPSLGAALNEQGDSTGQEYEKVKGGGRQIEDPSNKHVKLSLGNKFGALEGKDS